MKIQFLESGHGVNFTLYPETVEDSSQLLRFANNAKLENPEIYLSFHDKIRMEVFMSKIKPSVQQNSINPKRRKK